MKQVPAFDPRTLTREALLERAGVARPAASVVLLTDDPEEASRLAEVAAFAARTGRRLQIVAAVTRAVASVPSLPPGATFFTLKPDETLCTFVNRAAANAIGEIVVLAFGRIALSDATLASLIERFRCEPELGIASAGMSLGGGSWSARGAIAVRGELWSVLRGFEEAYTSPAWALRDLVLRTRAIGFDAPELPTAPDAEPESDEDARCFRQRAAVAPDLSHRGLAAPEGSSDRLTVYTAITDCYDVLKPQPRRVSAGANLVAFLDDATAAAHGDATRGWRVVDHAKVTDDPQRASRFYKINAHLALPDAPITLWVDASISLVFPFSPARLVALFLSEADICVFRHHARQSIYEEAEACKLAGRDSPEIIDAQMARYRAEGLPDDTGLAELPVILRRDTAATRALNEAWWAEIMAGSRRDQLSFNYVAWRLGIPYATFPMSMFAGNGLFIKFTR